MGSTVVRVRLRGPRGELELNALVDTGFFGDVITTSRVAKALGIELRYERVRRLPNGETVRVRFGGAEIEIEGLTTFGDVEVWDNLTLPEGVDALLGVTALEKLGLRIDPRSGRLERTELYLL